MFCDNCGEELRDGSRFCSHCGYDNKALLQNNSSYVKQLKSSNGTDGLKKCLVAAIDKIISLFNWYVGEWKSIFAKNKANDKRLIWCGTHIGGVLIIICLLVVCLSHHSKSNEKREPYLRETYDSDMQVSNFVDTEDKDEEKDSYSELIDEGKEALTEVVEDVKYAKQVLFSSLRGKWMDKNGLFSITFNDDNTLTIKDASGVIGADLFTYTEVDDHTITLKADSDNVLANIISLNLEYEVDGKVLTVSIAGMKYELERIK